MAENVTVIVSVTNSKYGGSRMKVYTIRDIARLAGVSVTTVSRVLNHRPDVNPETRVRVEKIIQENHADHAKDVKVYTTFNKITYKYLMLPIWCSSFKYQDKVYQFMVNGQTGNVYGKTPISVGKVILVIAIILAIIAIFACCFGGYSTIQDIIANMGN